MDKPIIFTKMHNVADIYYPKPASSIIPEWYKKTKPYNNESGKKELDEFFSGRYLVSAVRHVIQTQGVFQTILEIVKNTTEGKYTSPVSGLSYGEPYLQ